MPSAAHFSNNAGGWTVVQRVWDQLRPLSSVVGCAKVHIAAVQPGSTARWLQSMIRAGGGSWPQLLTAISC
jgi:hypothetical protein